ncbi:MAG: hypothetical protein EPN57_13245 [Paraburkholderia sp.]|nr:MAG: hypothetical protein EPN57_13245 [Paraburkholderia sp.]
MSPHDDKRPTLTVHELIAKLNTPLPDARGIVDGSEGGVDEVLGAKLCTIIVDGDYCEHDSLGMMRYSPREDGVEGEHPKVHESDRDDPDYEEAVFLDSRRALLARDWFPVVRSAERQSIPRGVRLAASPSHGTSEIEVCVSLSIARSPISSTAT